MQRIPCGEIWGGNRNDDVDLCTAALTASLFSSAAEGGKGGDLYYFSVCNADEVTRIALADVVGHGRAVSHISDWLYEGLAEYMNTLDGYGILGKLNAQATEREFDAVTTATVATLYKSGAQLLFAYAGHPPALYQPSDGGPWQPINLAPVDGDGLANLPLGVTPDVRYDQQVRALKHGDRLLLYSDGLLEAPSVTGELFGHQRLIETLNATGMAELYDVKRSVLDAIRTHTGGSLKHDDVTLMAIEVTWP